MTPQANKAEQARWLRVKDVFSEASEAEPEKRDAIVDSRCGADAELAIEVRSLLRLREEDVLSLDRPTPSGIAYLESVAPPRHNCGEVLAGRYRIERYLCAGGMGEVYAALDLNSGMPVALKFMHAFPTGRPQALSRFRREVALAQSIHHPNVCRTLDLAGPEDEPFCVMDLLDGETLAQRLTEGGAMSPEEALPLALQMCDGLAAAHAAGVLHRDLKPGNVFLVGGRAILIDFGLASAMDRASSLTSAGAVMGTLAYMAPEQLQGETATTASDVYALGVIFYEMLAGTKPFAAKSPLRLAVQKSSQSGGSARLQGVPAVWQEAIGRCLHAIPAKRFQTPAELRRVLERGKPSIAFVLTRPKVLWPLSGAVVLLSGWLAWTSSNRDLVPLPEAAALFVEAQDAMAQSSPWRGVQLLERAVKLDPQFIQARSLLTVGYAESDHLDEARESILAATAAADRRWRLGRGERLSLDAARAVVMRDFPSAIAAYRAMAENSQGAEHSSALLSLARTSVQHGRPEESIRTLHDLIKRHPENTAARVLLAGLLSRKGQVQEAAKEYAAAELVYGNAGNQEGLSDVLLARAGTRSLQSVDRSRQDAQKVLELSAKTGNRYHHLMAKFRLAAAEQADGRFDESMLLAREAAGQAEREGMLALAALAMGEFGYGFLSKRLYQPAADVLGEAVKMAERSRSFSALATNRLRLGEILTSLNRLDDGIKVMRPAVEWFRQGGQDSTLPLVLIKWGTLQASLDPTEAERSFLEALQAAEKLGDEMYQSMALQRLGGFYAVRDLRKSAEYHERALPLIRKVRNTGVFFQAAGTATNLGHFQKAEEWIAEGERQIAGYSNNLNRVFTTEGAHRARAQLLYSQGLCAEGLRELAKIRNKDNIASLGLTHELQLRRMKVCAFPELAGRNLDWAVERLRLDPGASSRVTSDTAVAAGEFALKTGNWKLAKWAAGIGLDVTSRSGFRTLELENLLVLRAAEMHLGNSEQDFVNTQKIFHLASDIGIGAPPDFGGRHDLQVFWKLAEVRK